MMTSMDVVGLQRVLGQIPNNVIKRVAGGSVENNRVPTVNQVIKFLKKTRRKSYKNLRRLANELEKVYPQISRSLGMNRILRGTVRNDAYDINECLDFLVSNL